MFKGRDDGETVYGDGVVCVGIRDDRVDSYADEVGVVGN